MKRLLSILLAIVMLGSISVLAADEEPLPDDDMFTFGEASESGDIPIIMPETGAQPAINLPRRARLSGPSGLPSSYDPRESGYLPPVRDQGNWYTCWMVAAVGAAEIACLKNDLIDANAQDIDLSERHALYFMTRQNDDPLGNSSGDYNLNLSARIVSGGNPLFSSMSFASWHGVASESATNSYYGGLSSNDELDPSYAYTDALHLKNTYALSVSTPAGREALKSLLLEHGSAVLCMYYNNSYLFVGSPSAMRAAQEPAVEDAPESEQGTLDGGAEAGSEPEGTVEPEAAAESEDTAEPEAAAELEPGPEETAEPEPPEETPAPGESAESEALGEPAAQIPEDELPADEDGLPALEPELDGGAEAASEETVPEGEPETVPEAVSGAESEVPADEPPPSLDGTADDFTACYYQNAETTTSHEILIIGWDDDYPAENFGYSPMGAVPPQDGAWLCRNSYGADYGDGGYFWVSYYDASVINANPATADAQKNSIGARVTVFEFAPADDYDNNYEYDGAVNYNYVKGTIGSSNIQTKANVPTVSRYYANIFTASAASASEREFLRAVSTFTFFASVKYNVSVYTGLADPADPTSGALAASTGGTFAYAGFHTVELPDSVYLKPGETFSVVFQIFRGEDHSILIPSCQTINQTYYSVNDIQTGQSFVSISGSDWVDCITLSGTPNVRIKAYTDTYSGPVPAVSDDGGRVTLRGAGALSDEVLFDITADTIVALDSRVGSISAAAAEKLRAAGGVVITPYAQPDGSDDYSSIMRQLREQTGISDLCIVGDACCDDKYDVADLTCLIDEILATEQTQPKIVYDVNGDHTVNVLDLTALARFMVGFTDSVGD